MSSPFDGPRPDYLDEVKHWPEDLRQVLERKASAWAKAKGITIGEAEFLAYGRLMRGHYKLPPVEVDAGADGQPPAWAAGLPVELTVVFS